MLTARTENFLRGRPDLGDTIERLQGFEGAGADVLYAPNLPDLGTIRTVCASVSRPVNVMAGAKHQCFPVNELTAAGVRRVSLGPALFRYAMAAFLRGARDVREHGTFGFAEDAISFGELIKYNLFLFADEAYREFCYEGTHTSAMHLKGAEQNVVLMDTISKRYSACGGRIGAFITKNKEVLNVAMKFAQARLSPPYYAQVLGEAAVDLPDDYFDTTKAEYKLRRDTLVNALNKIDGVFCPNPGGAFYVMAKLPIDDCDKFCQWLLEEFSYEGNTVMMAPATGFYATPGLGKDEVRLAYVLNAGAIAQAAECLKEALKVYPGRQ